MTDSNPAPPTEPPRPDQAQIVRTAHGTPIITGLSADLVPTPLYATRRWFFSSPLWYYHLPVAASGVAAAPAACVIHAGDRFYELIDPGIRGLCRLINEAGLRTTPSCEGHFYPAVHFRKVWDELRREAARIARAGLPVRDSETGEEFLFRDRAYALPWPELDSFFAEAGAAQGAGFLGVVIPPEHPRRDELSRRLTESPYRSGCPAGEAGDKGGASAIIQPQPNLDRQLGGRYFGVTVLATTPESRDQQWRLVTRYFTELLDACQTKNAKRDGPIAAGPPGDEALEPRRR
jgi:hypothetical protein